MKKYILFIAVSLCAIQVYPQGSKNQDFIIVVNGKVASACDIELALADSSGNQRIVNGKYIPGNLTLAESDYELLIRGDSLKMAFSLPDQKPNETKQYVLDAEQAWFGNYYCIVYIYDLNLRVNRRLFYPLDTHRNYTFEYTIPSYGMIRERKK